MTGLAQTPLWQELARHRDELKSTSLRDLVFAVPGRLENFQISCGGLRLNYAFAAVAPKTIELLAKLAAQQNIEAARAGLFRGDKANTTEKRAALHTALRQKTDAPVMVDGHDVIPEIRAAQKRMAQFADDVRSGNYKGATGRPIRDIVNIGIGGSDLGPRLAVKALAPFASGPRVHFVANADAFELVSALKDCDPASTLFLVVSKTFTTEETLLNARSARQWLVEKLNENAVSQQFIGITGNEAAARKFGIAPENIFPVWDWIGGRMSLWSAVGLAAMLAMGPKHFAAMCDGGAAMDEHFFAAPPAQNMPILLGLLAVWHRNFCGMRAHAVLPYGERLRELPRYLQQLEMESNGKSVTREGKPVDYETAPVIFGECGSVGQHSFHQWLHQGSDIASSDFIGVAADDLGKPDHHRALAANMVAQAGALAFGNVDAKSAFAICAGGRPSNLILLDGLDPYHFGMLLALYEHKVFVEGAIWGLNSFDQPGVELGKNLARGLEAGKPPQGQEEAFLAQLLGLASTSTKN